MSIPIKELNVPQVSRILSCHADFILELNNSHLISHLISNTSLCPVLGWSNLEPVIKTHFMPPQARYALALLNHSILHALCFLYHRAHTFLTNITEYPLKLNVTPPIHSDNDSKLELSTATVSDSKHYKTESESSTVIKTLSDNKDQQKASVIHPTKTRTEEKDPIIVESSVVSKAKSSTINSKQKEGKAEPEIGSQSEPVAKEKPPKPNKISDEVKPSKEIQMPEEVSNRDELPVKIEEATSSFDISSSITLSSAEVLSQSSASSTPQKETIILKLSNKIKVRL